MEPLAMSLRGLLQEGDGGMFLAPRLEDGLAGRRLKS